MRTISSNDLTEDEHMYSKYDFLKALVKFELDLKIHFPVPINFQYKATAEDQVCKDRGGAKKVKGQFVEAAKAAAQLLLNNKLASYKAISTDDDGYPIMEEFALTAAGYVFFEELRFSLATDSNEETLNENWMSFSSAAYDPEKCNRFFNRIIKEIFKFTVQHRLT